MTLRRFRHFRLFAIGLLFFAVVLPTHASGLVLTTNHQLWDQSPDIVALQQWLNNNGYPVAKTGPGSPKLETLTFGPLTYRALVGFQKAQGLPTTGFLGPLTRAKIAQISALSTNAPTTSVASPASTLIPKNGCPAPMGLSCLPGTSIVQPAAPGNDYTPGFGGGGGDTIPPVISGSPANSSATATSLSGAAVTFANPTATDNVDGTDPVTCSPASGSTFAIGVTTVTCTATDKAGNSSHTSFTVTVSANAPSVSLTAPSNGALLAGSSVALSATASDPTGVATVQFKVDGTNIGSAITSSPYTTTWNSTGVADGSHTLYAVALNNAGKYATSSVSVTVDNTPPTVSLTAPSSGATVSGSSVTLTATASDNVAVASVQFEVDGTDIGAAAKSSPYTTTWNSTGVADGAHTLYAVAEDTAGNYATSSVALSVRNSPPVISAIATSSVSDTSGTITWATDEAATSQINYGPTVAYGFASSSASLVTSHSVALVGLTASSTYHFQIQSTDSLGNTVSSSDETFTTTAPVTFNPSDETANIALSNGNLTATGNNGSSNPQIRSNVGLSSGKVHFEIIVTTMPSENGNLGFGIASASHNMTTKYCGQDTTSLCIYDSGSYYLNGSHTLFSRPFMHQGDVIAIEIDFGAQLIWFKNVTDSSYWNNSSSANPTTDTGGISIAGLTGAPYYIIYDAGDNSDAITLNVGENPLTAPYGLTPSTGFTNWDGSIYNGLYTNFTLAYSDNFAGSSVDAVGPSTPDGKYFMTRGYGLQSSGPSIEFRGTTGSGGDPGYMTDPSHTGYDDANRGVAVGYTNVRQTNGDLTLQARAATAAELNTLQDPVNSPNVDAILSGEGAVKFFPATSSPIIVEARLRFSAHGTTPEGWQPAFWTLSGAPSAYGAHNEWDIFEVDSSSGNALAHSHTCTSRTSCSASDVGTWNNSTAYDGNYHTYTIVLQNGGDVYVYLDGALQFSSSQSANTALLPMYFMIDSWFNTPFDQSSWNASGTSTTSGGSVDVSSIRVWNQIGAPNYQPLQSVSDLQLAYNGTGSIVLPSASALWGDSSVTEYVQCRPMETNEPGTSASSSYQQFPSYVSYNSTTRTISVDFSSASGNAGVIHCMDDAYKITGSTDEPLRFNIYRGPHLTPASPLSAAHGSPYSHDFYNDCDVGIVTPKTINVIGLPAGLTFDGVSAISGTPTSAGTSTLTVSCTNNVGQEAQQTVQLQVN